MHFNKYDRTTQITSLPGGIKRQHHDIRDDSKPIIVKNHHAHKMKVNLDYNSNVSCLPGKNVNRTQEDKTYNQESRKHLVSDIFNTNHQTTNYNSFNISNKTKDNRNYQQSFNEKKVVHDGRSKRPEQIRNAFRSQLTIS